MNRREAMKKTIELHRLSQAEISRRTVELEKAGVGKKVDVAQLNRYLKGHKDLYSEAQETLENALDETARAFYLGLIYRGSSH